MALRLKPSLPVEKFVRLAFANRVDIVVSSTACLWALRPMRRSLCCTTYVCIICFWNRTALFKKYLQWSMTRYYLQTILWMPWCLVMCTKVSDNNNTHALPSSCTHRMADKLNKWSYKPDNRQTYEVCSLWATSWDRPESLFCVHESYRTMIWDWLPQVWWQYLTWSSSAALPIVIIPLEQLCCSAYRDKAVPTLASRTKSQLKAFTLIFNSYKAETCQQPSSDMICAVRSALSMITCVQAPSGDLGPCTLAWRTLRAQGCYLRHLARWRCCSRAPRQRINLPWLGCECNSWLNQLYIRAQV